MTRKKGLLPGKLTFLILYFCLCYFVTFCVYCLYRNVSVNKLVAMDNRQVKTLQGRFDYYYYYYYSQLVF